MWHSPPLLPVVSARRCVIGRDEVSQSCRGSHRMRVLFQTDDTIRYGTVRYVFSIIVVVQLRTKEKRKKKRGSSTRFVTSHTHTHTIHTHTNYIAEREREGGRGEEGCLTLSVHFYVVCSGYTACSWSFIRPCWVCARSSTTELRATGLAGRRRCVSCSPSASPARLCPTKQTNNKRTRAAWLTNLSGCGSRAARAGANHSSLPRPRVGGVENRLRRAQPESGARHLHQLPDAHAQPGGGARLCFRHAP